MYLGAKKLNICQGQHAKEDATQRHDVHPEIPFGQAVVSDTKTLSQKIFSGESVAANKFSISTYENTRRVSWFSSTKTLLQRSERPE